MPRVSVLLNCYNQSTYVTEAIESVLNQTFQDFELIITDNGSTDNTPEILKRYANDPRVHLILREKNGNVSRCFNNMIQAAKGEWISLLLSDDYYLPNKLQRQIAIADQPGNNSDIIYGPILRLHQATNQTVLIPVMEVDPENPLKSLLINYQDGPIQFIPPLIRRECYLNYPFLETVFFEGESIFLRMAIRYKFHYDLHPTCVMRDTGKNWGKAFKKNVEAIWISLDAIKSDPAFIPAIHGPALNTYKSMLLRNVAWCNLRLNGSTRWSFAKFLEASKYDPRQLLHKRFLCGLLIGILPASIRAQINRFANKKMGVSDDSGVMESFEGEIKA